LRSKRATSIMLDKIIFFNFMSKQYFQTHESDQKWVYYQPFEIKYFFARISR